MQRSLSPSRVPAGFAPTHISVPLAPGSLLYRGFKGDSWAMPAGAMRGDWLATTTSTGRASFTQARASGVRALQALPMFDLPRDIEVDAPVCSLLVRSFARSCRTDCRT